MPLNCPGLVKSAATEIHCCRPTLNGKKEEKKMKILLNRHPENDRYTESIVYLLRTKPTAVKTTPSQHPADAHSESLPVWHRFMSYNVVSNSKTTSKAPGGSRGAPIVHQTATSSILTAPSLTLSLIPLSSRTYFATSPGCIQSMLATAKNITVASNTYRKASCVII